MLLSSFLVTFRACLLSICLFLPFGYYLFIFLPFSGIFFGYLFLFGLWQFSVYFLAIFSFWLSRHFQLFSHLSFWTLCEVDKIITLFSIIPPSNFQLKLTSIYLFADLMSTLCKTNFFQTIYRKTDGATLISQNERNLDCAITFQTHSILQRFLVRFDSLHLDCNDRLFIYDGAHASGEPKVIPLFFY